MEACERSQQGGVRKARDRSDGGVFRADIPDVIRAFDRSFGVDTYSLKSMFRDEQRNILSRILISTLDEAEAVYRQLMNTMLRSCAS